MANTILTPTIITKEALRILHEKLVFCGAINRQYDNRFAQTGAKIGNTLQIRLPNKFTVRTGATLSAQDVTEQKVDLTVAYQAGVDVNFTSEELTLDLDNFSKRILEPAMATLAAYIESKALEMYADVYNLVGTPGSTPDTLSTYLSARAKLNQFLCPKDRNRTVVINSEASAGLIDNLKGLFNPQADISEVFREGMIGRTAGFAFYESEQIPTHTNGTQGGTPLVNGANQTGSSLVTDGWTAGATITKGTVFTIAGVYAVHPETKASYAFLQQFVVTEDATADGSGNATLSISPSIVTSGAYQNVSNSPADNAAITIVGSASTGYPQNLAFHRDAFVLVTADLVMPKGVDFAAREVYDGISMRIVRQYDINNDRFPCRIDVLFGYKCVRPELACRITG